MNYTDDAFMVRVDFFKESGKWYTTEAVRWTGGYRDVLIHRAFIASLENHLQKEGKAELRLSGMTAVCLEPYHEHACPIMMTVERLSEYDARSNSYKPLKL